MTSETVPRVLFVLLLLLCGVLGLLFFGLEPHPGAVGGIHPEFETMQQGGPSSRHDGRMSIAFLFVLLQIALFVGLLVQAIGRRLFQRLGVLWLSLGSLALTGAFAGLFLSYLEFMDAGANSALALSFPVPSAWMLYGVWTAPLFFIALYVVRFDDWILLPEDRKRFEELVAAKQASAEKGGE